jgi:hypothetical protein
MEKRITEKASQSYQLAYQYADAGGHCSQNTIRALFDVYGLHENAEEANRMFRALGALAGGCGCEGDAGCGAYTAVSFFFGLHYGLNIEDTDTDNPPLKNRGDEVYTLVKQLHHRFIDKYGSVICSQIHRKLFHRPFYIGDEEEHQKLKDLVASRKQDPEFRWCAHVCGDAAQWAVEIFESTHL